MVLIYNICYDCGHEKYLHDQAIGKGCGVIGCRCKMYIPSAMEEYGNDPVDDEEDQDDE